MRLEGRTIAILATDGADRVELTEPRRVLEREGARCVVVAEHRALDHVQARHADRRLADVDVHEFDGLMLPGAIANPGALRRNAEAIALVRAFAQAGKPIAAISHAPWLLVEMRHGHRKRSCESAKERHDGRLQGYGSFRAFSATAIELFAA